MFQSTKILILGVLFASHPLAAIADSAAERISIGDPYVRAVPEGQKNSAVFMVLTNQGGEDHALVDARSTAAHVVELHTHVNEDGMMKMRRIDRIELASGSTTNLEPGGLHVMLIGLEQTIDEGDEVTVSLVFQDGSTIEVAAPARKFPTTMPSNSHDGAHTPIND